LEQNLFNLNFWFRSIDYAIYLLSCNKGQTTLDEEIKQEFGVLLDLAKFFQELQAKKPEDKLTFIETNLATLTKKINKNIQDSPELATIRTSKQWGALVGITGVGIALGAIITLATVTCPPGIIFLLAIGIVVGLVTAPLISLWMIRENNLLIEKVEKRKTYPQHFFNQQKQILANNKEAVKETSTSDKVVGLN
jgi:hypothetical protein